MLYPLSPPLHLLLSLFFFNDPAPTEIYTLSLHDALPILLAALAGAGGAGNVTVPHKEAAERCVARKTDVCARVGACNTFWTEHGALVGDNTDVAGTLAALRQLGADGAGS